MTEQELKPGKFLKDRMITEYAERLKDSSAFFVTEYAGLTNKDLIGLRKKLKSSSAKYLVVKNSLCKSALKNLKLNELVGLIDGPCALSYGNGDPVTISKVLVDFAKANDKLRLRGGYIEGKIITVDTVKELASLPSREVLLMRLLSAINSPITGFVSACSGIIKKLLYALNEIANKKQENK